MHSMRNNNKEKRNFVAINKQNIWLNKTKMKWQTQRTTSTLREQRTLEPDLNEYHICVRFFFVCSVYPNELYFYWFDKGKKHSHEFGKRRFYCWLFFLLGTFEVKKGISWTIKCFNATFYKREDLIKNNLSEKLHQKLASI